MKKLLLSLSCLFTATLIEAQTVSTLAGSSTTGFLDGPAATAQFNTPTGIAIDGSGSIFIADQYNSRIRKLSTSAVVSTYAGTGAFSFSDGPVATAELKYPYGVAVDAAGTVYIADQVNNRIRVVSTSGIVSTLAGTGVAGYLDGPGATAKFNGPKGIAVDAIGNVYVGEGNGLRIRKIDVAGNVTTIAGTGVFGYLDGPGTTAMFGVPTALAVDAVGNIYVGDVSHIRKIDVMNNVTTYAGSGLAGFADGPALSATFASAEGIAIDAAGNLYIADATNHRIRKITTAGMVSTLAGSGAYGYLDGAASTAQFHTPNGVAVDAVGNVYVIDQYNKRVRKISGVTTDLSDNTTSKPVFELYPNPTSELININVSNLSVTEMVTEQGRSIEVTITNTLGQVVLNDKITNTQSSFNVQHFVSGVYFVTVTDSKGNTSVKKIIKE